MKNLMKGADLLGSSNCHYVRLISEKGADPSGSTKFIVVETGVIDPFENDFYLQSHAAIKGTARLAHYYVLLNEANMSND